jgi:hypothetical protein
MDLSTIIQAYILRRGGSLSLSVSSLAREIDDYVHIRKTTSFCMVRRSKKPDPKGWTVHHEDVWQDWISLNFDIQSWEEEVINFIHSEYKDMAMELHSFIEDWVQREIKIVTKFDKEPLEEVVEELYGGLDPYMVEHGLIKGVYRDSMVRDQED